jgi:hypothetical protein
MSNVAKSWRIGRAAVGPLTIALQLACAPNALQMQGEHISWFLSCDLKLTKHIMLCRWKFLATKGGKVSTVNTCRRHCQDKGVSDVCTAFVDSQGDARRFQNLPLSWDMLAMIKDHCFPVGDNVGNGVAGLQLIDAAGADPIHGPGGGLLGGAGGMLGGVEASDDDGDNGIGDADNDYFEDQPVCLGECMPGYDGAKCMKRAPSAKALHSNGTAEQKWALQLCLMVTHEAAQRKWKDADINTCLKIQNALDVIPEAVRNLLPKTAAQLRTLMTDSIPVPTEYRYTYCPTFGCNRLYRVEMRDHAW